MLHVCPGLCIDLIHYKLFVSNDTDSYFSLIVLHGHGIHTIEPHPPLHDPQVLDTVYVHIL